MVEPSSNDIIIQDHMYYDALAMDSHHILLFCTQPNCPIHNSLGITYHYVHAHVHLQYINVTNYTANNFCITYKTAISLYIWHVTRTVPRLDATGCDCDCEF